MTPERPRLLPVVVNTVVLWITIALSSILLWPIYQGSAFIVLVVVTTLVASALAIAGAYFRWSSAVLLLATVAAFVLLGVPLAVPQEALYGVLPSLDGLRQLVSGVALGWKQLLTITLPVGNYQALLVPPFVLLLVLVVVALSLALRSRFGGLAVLAPLIIFVVGVIFGPDYATWPLETTLGLAFVCLLWLMWRRWYARRQLIDRLATEAAASTGGAPAAPVEHRIVGLRPILSGVLILAIAGGAATAASLVIPPDGRRQVLRTSIEQPFDPRDYVSPLAGFRKYLLDGASDSVLFTVDGLPDDARIRIATLDSYDGVVYSVGSEEVDSASGSFTRVPTRFDQSAVSGEQLDLDVEIVGYTGVWMPTVGKLESVAFSGSRTTRLRDSFYYNDNGGTAAIVGGLRSGDGYELDAVLPVEPGDGGLSVVQPGAASVPPLGVLPAELEPVLSRFVDGVDGPGAQLLAMVQGLRETGYISHGIDDDEPSSRSGHSADRVTQLLTDQRMIGDAEQYAVTAALMARQIGFPARVVFGFAPEVATTGPTDVTGSAVSAWIEVNTEQYGWITVNPVPPVREIPAEEPEDPTVVSRPQQVIPPQATDPIERPAETPLDTAQDDPEQLAPWLVIVLVVLRVVGWVALVVAVVLAPFLFIVAAKARRRRQRRLARDPLARIRGGWQEYADAIIDHGYEAPATATRRELAAVVGGGKSAVLAAVADRAVFSPVESAPDDADKVWRAVGELTSNLDVGRTRWERIKARISLRSLGGYSFSRKTTRQE